MDMVIADTPTRRAERTAAERIGMDVMGVAMREDARLFKELGGGFRRLGEAI